MLPGSSDLKFLSMHFWLGPMGLASRAGSMALLTSFGGKGPHLKHWLVTLLCAPDGFLTEVFLSHKANARKSVALPPVSPSSPLSSSLQRLTDETDVNDPGQMAYQAGNPWLRLKLVWSHCSLRALQALPADINNSPAVGKLAEDGKETSQNVYSGNLNNNGV